MLTYLQALIIGALQGLTELFPISSLGHTVILPSVLGWQLDQHAPFFVVFLVATHLATALVLLAFFWKDWLLLIRGFFRSLFARRIAPGDIHARLIWLLIIATIPAGLLGLLFQHMLESLFATPSIVAFFLILNGLVLYAAELLRRRAQAKGREQGGGDAALAKLSIMQALGIGLMQCLALLPGFSRTGATLAGGLVNGLSHEDAARFSFLMATPIILAAGVLKLPDLLLSMDAYPTGQILAGTLAAAVAAYLSVRFLTGYFKTKTLVPFALYCIIAGVLVSLLLWAR